jgi:hypothetical protein
LDPTAKDLPALAAQFFMLPPAFLALFFMAFAGLPIRGLLLFAKTSTEEKIITTAKIIVFFKKNNFLSGIVAKLYAITTYFLFVTHKH